MTPVPGPGRLLRADGAVIVPPAVAGEVLRAVVRDLTARVRADGGQVAPRGPPGPVRAAPGRTTHRMFESTTAPFDSSATGSPSHQPRRVAQAATLMGCPPRHIRALITGGRLPTQRVGARA